MLVFVVIRKKKQTDLPISNVAVNIAQLTLPTSGGVYLLSAGMNFTGVGTGVNISYSVIGNIMQTVGNPVGSYAGITLPTLAYTSTSTNQIIYLRAQNNGLANTAQTVMFSAIRIA